MKKVDLLEKIHALEQRIAALELRPYWSIYPATYPKFYPVTYPAVNPITYTTSSYTESNPQN
jgi:hypothetical protein